MCLLVQVVVETLVQKEAAAVASAAAARVQAEESSVQERCLVCTERLPHMLSVVRQHAGVQRVLQPPDALCTLQHADGVCDGAPPLKRLLYGFGSAPVCCGTAYCHFNFNAFLELRG